MKLAKLIMTEREFKTNPTLNTKFDYDTPIQLIGQVIKGESLYYLAVKHKHSTTGYAKFNWFHPARFESFLREVSISTLKKTEDIGNNYYWVNSNDLGVKRVAPSSKKTMGKLFLVKPEEIIEVIEFGQEDLE